jgi:hypothetical protein
MDNLTPVAEKNQSRPFAISTRLIAVMATIWIGFGILEHWTGFRAANKFLAIGIFVPCSSRQPYVRSGQFLST